MTPRGTDSLEPEWGPIQPLTAYGELPVFPVNKLPEVLRDWCHAEAESTQTPLALPALLSLSACAVALQGKIVVSVRPGWTEPVNLFTGTALDPGSRKTAVEGDAFQPVREWERQENERTREDLAVAHAAYDTLTRALDYATKQAAQTEGEARAEAVRRRDDLARELANTGPPIAARLLADDCTPEKLAVLMSEQGGRMAVASAEGGIFDMMAGRYSNGVPNLDVYLKGHAGESLRVDRKGSPPVHVPHPALTLALAVQPQVLRLLSGQRAMQGRGLLERFLYAIPDSGIGRRNMEPRIMPAQVSTAYHALIRTLLSIPFAEGEPRMVELSANALSELISFGRELEPKLSRVGELGHIAGWGSKLVGAVARVAGIFHTVESREGLIGVEAVFDARAIAEDFLIPHALAAFEIMGGKKQVFLAGIARDWVKRKGQLEFSRRDLNRDLDANVENSTEWDAPLRLNVETNVLREIPQEPGKLGRPSLRFEVNPAFLNGSAA